MMQYIQSINAEMREAGHITLNMLSLKGYGIDLH